jgi:hypothetical protein
MCGMCGDGCVWMMMCDVMDDERGCGMGCDVCEWMM